MRSTSSVYERIFRTAARRETRCKTGTQSTSVAVSDLNSHRKKNYQRCYVYIIIFGKTYYRIYVDGERGINEFRPFSRAYTASCAQTCLFINSV